MQPLLGFDMRVCDHTFVRANIAYEPEQPELRIY